MKPNKNNQWLAFAGIPAQLGLTIYLFNYLGVWLDTKYKVVDVKNGYETWLTLVGVFVGIYSIIRQVITLSNKK